LVSIIGIVAVPDAPSASDANIGIGDPMASVVNPNLQIESYRHQHRLVTECPRLTPEAFQLASVIYFNVQCNKFFSFQIFAKNEIRIS
jgi:hypothetical protein